VHHDYTVLVETLSATQDTAIIRGDGVGSTAYTVIYPAADRTGSGQRSMMS